MTERSPSQVEEIEPPLAKQLMDDSHPLIVDIRDPESYQEAHIVKAIHLTDQNIAEFIAGNEKIRPIICYCYHGLSSQMAADFLCQQGFERVYSLKGGFEQWRAVYPELIQS